MESGIHLQAFLPPAPNAAFNLFSSDFITKEMELIIIPTLWFGGCGGKGEIKLDNGLQITVPGT